MREAIRRHVPDLSLGGWANPHADRGRRWYWLSRQFTAEFFLTQVVSHHDGPGRRFSTKRALGARIDLPGMFGVFYYRSANPRTLDTLRKFLPVPIEG